MRNAIILGRRHGGKALEVVSGPEHPIEKQLDTFKEFLRKPTNDRFEHVELWTSDGGRRKHRKLSKPVPQPKTK